MALGDNLTDVHIYDAISAATIDKVGKSKGPNASVGGGPGCIYNKEEIPVWAVDETGHADKDDAPDSTKVTAVI